MVDQQREAFESWVTTVWRPDNGAELLKRDYPRMAFAAWQAAQAADAGREEPVQWQSRYVGDPRQPGFWDRIRDEVWAKAVYDLPNHTTEEGWEVRPVYAKPQAVAINAELVEALEALLGPEDDPHIGWWGTAQTSIDHFRCEHCGVEDLNSVKLRHKDDCRVVKARAALSRAKEQK